jgi:hypothetical protein
MLLNAFSLNMLENLSSDVSFSQLYSAEEAKVLLMCLAEEAGSAGIIDSAVGDAYDAAIYALILGIPVPIKRVNVTLKKGDRFVVGQYIGPRLEEGATSLPEGAVIKWVAGKVA